MMRDIFKQMLPFILFMALLWLMAEFLESVFEEQSGPKILESAAQTPTPSP
jgi:hypothetical protein